jgi:hypothetical protein
MEPQIVLERGDLMRLNIAQVEAVRKALGQRTQVVEVVSISEEPDGIKTMVVRSPQQ